MSGYGYGPPPPPPPTGTGHTHNNHHRGGGGRGRGHHHSSSGRGDHRGALSHYPYPPPQSYHGQAPQSYTPGSYPPPSNYAPPQPQWPAQGHNAAPAAPYAPSYPPQHYPPAPYPHQPTYNNQQQPYGQPYTAPPAQWSGQGPSSRPRGGHHPGVPTPGPSYEHEHAQPPPSGGYSQPYAQNPRTTHYSPPPRYPFSGPPVPPPPSSRNDSHHNQHSRRGRGNGPRDRGMRGRGRGGGNNHVDRPNTQKQNPPPVRKTASSPVVNKRKKRKGNTLGLTPAVESESEDDEGEEEALTELIGSEAMSISDVAVFIAERKKNFPTKARMEAKKAAELQQKKEMKDDKAAALEKQADDLRRQLRKVESSIKRKREQTDDGDNTRDTSNDSSGDDQPEEMSTRAQPRVAATAKPAEAVRHCKYYSTGGTCGKKGKCRFVHDPEVREAAIKEREANNGRLTIKQRLILNDKEQDELAVLQSIQYLRGKGLMSAASTPQNKDQAKDHGAGPVPRPVSSLLPTPPASLPPLPPKKETLDSPEQKDGSPSLITEIQKSGDELPQPYEGWDLRPYGNSTDGKNAV